MRVRGGQHRLRGGGAGHDQGPGAADGARLEVPMTDGRKRKSRQVKNNES